MFLLPPDFFYKKCLNIHIEKRGRDELAKMVNKGEPTIRGWFRKGSVPERATEIWFQHFEKLGNEQLVKEINRAMDEPFLVNTDAHKWQLLCHGILTNEDAFLPYTFGEILSHSEQYLEMLSSVKNLQPDQRLAYFKEYLQNVAGPKFKLPENLHLEMQQCKDLEELRPVMAWLIVETFIYFLSMAEVEYLWFYHQIEEPKLSRIILPEIHKGKVQYPVKRFFGCFFDNLISKGFHQSLDDIADKMPRIVPRDNRNKEGQSDIDKESRWRELKRAKYEGKAPSFETFGAWFDKLIPSEIYSSQEERNLEKQFLCDAFGAARIIDTFFKEVSKKDIPKKELVDRFRSYESWHRFHNASIVAI